MAAEDSRKLARTAMEFLPFEPLETQAMLLHAAASFVTDGGPRDVFVLNGYAGTGKTSLMGAFIKALGKVRVPVVMLAPTGRAAKVAEGFSGHPASTIHRRIFRPVTGKGGTESWYVARNECKDTLFIVDEASLINDSGGNVNGLLAQLVRYVYSAPGCRLMLVGDEAQLPPVGQSEATAMNHDRLRGLGLNPIGFSLDVPVRQAAGSGVVHNATLMRHFLMSPPPSGVPELHVSGYPEVIVASSRDLADLLSDSYAQVGEDETLIITRSNSRANKFNMAVRNMVMFAEEPIERGDRLVISKNDYYWGKRNKSKGLIANGDTAEVTWVGKTEKAYGRFFTEVEMRLSDGRLIMAQVMLRSLVTDGTSIPRAEMERFYNNVLASAEGELSEKIKVSLEDPYYNALQAKYAYCVTCHKAQGGQWKHVYVDMGGIAPDAIGPDFYRWVYTAITRATEKVFFLNPTIPVL